MGKRIQKVALKNLESKTLELGYVGENDHTQIRIDCTEVLWDYPNATASMVVQPPRGDLYPATLTTDDNYVVWTITDSDVAYAGHGQIQLTFTNNGEIVKSAICSTNINTSISATGTAPTPLENWLERAEETLAAVANAVPEAPSGNGVYMLTCTVNNGTTTYSWEVIA